MIDVHCHLQFHGFEKDYEEVAKRAFNAGVTKIINVGTKLDSSLKAVEFADKYEDMYAIIGFHPHHADKLEQNWLEELGKLADHKKVIGIGEIGLDYFAYQSNGIVDPKIQKNIFEKQVELAYHKKLPLQIHNRQAGEEIIEILTYHRKSLLTIPGMFHCFAGSLKILQSALNLGFFIGFDGNITYKGLAPGENTDLKDLARYVPMNRLVVETDSPFLAPVPHRGSRNEPAYVIDTAKFLAELKDVSFESFVEQATKNVYTIFDKLK